MCSGNNSGGSGYNCVGDSACSNNGSGNNNGCFPANATVLLPGSATKRMDELATGDAVAVRLADGSLGYQPIYAWCAGCCQQSDSRCWCNLGVLIHCIRGACQHNSSARNCQIGRQTAKMTTTIIQDH
jgi:hypothetical protein